MHKFEVYNEIQGKSPHYSHVSQQKRILTPSGRPTAGSFGHHLQVYSKMIINCTNVHKNNYVPNVIVVP